MTIPLSPHQSARAAALKPGETMMLIEKLDNEYGLNHRVDEWHLHSGASWYGYGDLGMCNGARGLITEDTCPHGAPGDTLEIETWECGEYMAVDDMGPVMTPVHLRVTGTRVCRAQEVSEADAKASGLIWPVIGPLRTPMWEGVGSSGQFSDFNLVLRFALGGSRAPVESATWLWLTTAEKVQP